MAKDSLQLRPLQGWLKSLGCFSGVGLLSSSLVISTVLLAEHSQAAAPTETEAAAEHSIPEHIQATATPIPDLPLATPDPSPRAVSTLDVPPAPEPVAAPAPPEVSEPEPLPPPTIAPPAMLEPEPAPAVSSPPPAVLSEDAPAPMPSAASPEPGRSGGGSRMIDGSDDYSVGATSAGDMPNAVILRERSTGCQQVMQGSQVSGCGPIRALPGQAPLGEMGPGQTAPGQTGPGVNVPGLRPHVQLAEDSLGPSGSGSRFGNLRPSMAPVASPLTQQGGNASMMAGYSVTFPRGMVNPVQVAVSSFGQTLSQSWDVQNYFARTPRPAGLLGNGDRSLLFPLSLPAPLTSAFGWRTHPIFGDTRFHSGVDFGADQGTPVVAVLSGRVNTADFIGGYGLTVVLDHGSGSHETLYGHLSEIYVRPGQVVRQGEVIGRVGSTGNSTGPHLHFEVRQLTAQGWVAIDPAQRLEGAIAGLMTILQGGDPSKLPEIAIASQPIDVAAQWSANRTANQANLWAYQQPRQPFLLSQAQQPQAPQTNLEQAIASVVQSLEHSPRTHTIPTYNAPTHSAPIHSVSGYNTPARNTLQPSQPTLPSDTPLSKAPKPTPISLANVGE